MVVGLLQGVQGHARAGSTQQPWGFLAAAYVILAFPYMFFSLDAGFRSIDVHTLTEASQSLGARWATTLFKVILPNIRAAALGGVVPDARDRDGRVHDREPRRVPHVPDLHPVRQRDAGLSRPARSTLMSFGITWAAMLSLLARRAEARQPGRRGRGRRR